MSTQPDSNERPEGFETREPVAPTPPSAERPDWLVGAEDVMGGEREAIERPKVPPPSTPGAGPLAVVPGGQPERPKAWSAAASSVPKLTVVPRREPPPTPIDDDHPGFAPLEDPLLPEATDDGDRPEAEPAGPAFRPLDEPWYLIWGETLATNRRLQIGLAVVLVLGAVLMIRPWSGSSGASLGNILRHPERFEGRSVTVRGEVLESFDIGDGHVFHLRQGRDTVVVFSPTRQPRLHERVEVVGTVSTGYLDGQPRVAIFESVR